MNQRRVPILWMSICLFLLITNITFLLQARGYRANAEEAQQIAQESIDTCKKIMKTLEETYADLVEARRQLAQPPKSPEYQMPLCLSPDDDPDWVRIDTNTWVRRPKSAD